MSSALGEGAGRNARRHCERRPGAPRLVQKPPLPRSLWNLQGLRYVIHTNTFFGVLDSEKGHFPRKRAFSFETFAFGRVS